LLLSGTTGGTGAASKDGTGVGAVLCLLCLREIVIQLTSSSGEPKLSDGRSTLVRLFLVP
jgi:hypothetical protein